MQHYAHLASAWPSALPPAKPVMEKSEVYATVSRIELAANALR